MKAFVFILLLMFSGCIVINTPGLYSGYKKLSPQQKDSIVFANNDDAAAQICALKNDGKIYAVNAAQLLNCLKEVDTAMVYIWSPHCGSKVCVGVGAAQRYCDSRNYTLFAVAEYYDMEMMNIHNAAQKPLFVINHLYYESDHVNKYRSRFEKELTAGKNLSKEEQYGRFFLFKKGELLKVKREITE